MGKAQQPKPGRQVGVMTADEIAQVPTIPRHIKTPREEMLKQILKEAASSSPIFSSPSWYAESEENHPDSFEMETRGQAKNPNWVSARRKMITGSIVYNILRTVEAGNFSRGPAERQINPPDLSNVPAIRWGRKHEKIALKKYEKVLGISTKDCGMFRKKELDYFGATPDALSSDGKTVIEIKCPYKSRFKKPSECLYVSANGKVLKKEYFAQVQAQMIVTEKENCDFVVWTTKGILIQNLKYNSKYAKRILKAADIYYNKVFIPLLNLNGLL